MNTKKEIKAKILLRGIDPADLYKKYLQGYTSDIKSTNSKIELLSTVELDYDIGKNKYSDIYEIVDVNNNKKRIFTTNTVDFIAALDTTNELNQNIDNTNIDLSSIKSQRITLNTLNGKVSLQDNSNIECPICGDICKKENSLGIPFKIIRGSDKKIIYIHVEGDYCSFECMYYVVRKNTRKQYRYIEPVWVDIEHNLILMYTLFNPNSPPIQELANPSLLVKNGGSLKLEDYKSKTHKYVQKPDIIMMPIKQQFTQLNIYK